jgi:hypothetical protein
MEINGKGIESTLGALLLQGKITPQEYEGVKNVDDAWELINKVIGEE